MHRYFVSDTNNSWARELVHQINLEAMRLDLPLDARMGHIENETEESDWPYTSYIEIERLDSHQLLSPGEHFEGFGQLAERLTEIKTGDIELMEPLLETCGLLHDPAPSRSLTQPATS